MSSGYGRRMCGYMRVLEKEEEEKREYRRRRGRNRKRNIT